MRAMLILGALTAVLYGSALADYVGRPDVQSYLDELVAEHGFEREALKQVFSAAERQQAILDAIARPAERVLEWHEYRQIFITDDRIEQGVEFWQENHEDLARAEEEYGVPAAMVVAIIGVETRFGRNKGRWRVIDALSTLAFDYPPRGDFFRRELTEFLLLAREEEIDPLSLRGSYAGAMGYGQFIPSSFRAYAIDFNGNGRRDIWNDRSDAIGSVANYFRVHGWQREQPVVARVGVDVPNPEALITDNLQLSQTVGELRGAGVALDGLGRLPDDEAAVLMRMQGSETQEYWLGLNNFYVITRYNRSSMYALAVFQLSAELEQAYRRAQSVPATRGG
jgi:membrane-bound lytic murein transglycosylase B